MNAQQMMFPGQDSGQAMTLEAIQKLEEATTLMLRALRHSAAPQQRQDGAAEYDSWTAGAIEYDSWFAKRR